MITGFLNVDKPKGITSHDVVARVRRLLRQQVGKVKVGHAGTLDPMATGVLVICVGNATRLSEYAMHGIKRYRGIVQLGIETDTYDAEGKILHQHDTDHITSEAIEAALQPFSGDIEQLPPMYSAIKVDGRKLYDVARAGGTVEREPRAVTVYQFDLVDWQPPLAIIDVTCSSGTYIRSLAHDLGQALGVGGTLTALRRIRSGNFVESDSIPLAELEVMTALSEALIAPADALAGALPMVWLKPADIDHISHGRTIPRHADEPEGEVMALTSGGDMVAILKAADDSWQPRKVFHNAE